MNKTFFLIFILPLFAFGQASSSGINWTSGLSWAQIKEKAKSENKHIFIDAFATWCGPCKEMDKYVYINDSIGNFFNDKFISIRVQMDQTKTDPESVKVWYASAEEIKKQYHVKVFPTFIFLSPEGVITHIDKGYKGINQFIAIAQTATKPGQVYKNPYAEYEELIDKYSKGDKNYMRMAYMFNIAFSKLRDMETARLLSKDYTVYLGKLKRSKLYTKDNIEFLAAVTNKSDSKWFPIFYSDYEKINKVMKDDNYAQRVVDKIIQREVVFPFLGIKGGGMGMMGVNTQTDHSEADWTRLEKTIRQKYNPYYTERNLLYARIAWYDQKYNHDSLAYYYLTYLDQYGMDSHDKTQYTWINHYAYSTCFLHVNNKVLLEKTVRWMKVVLWQYPKNAAYLDTYASLLYKIGDIEEAIIWEQRAVNIALEMNQAVKAASFQLVLDKMQKRLPLL